MAFKYVNTSQTLEGERIGVAVPSDDRILVPSFAELETLDTDLPDEPFRWYEGMVVYCLDTTDQYMWKESASGILTSGGYLYPPGFISAGVDYSSRTFNFVQIAGTGVGGGFQLDGDTNTHGSPVFVEGGEVMTIVGSGGINTDVSADNEMTIILDAELMDLNDVSLEVITDTAEWAANLGSDWVTEKASLTAQLTIDASSISNIMIGWSTPEDIWYNYANQPLTPRPKYYDHLMAYNPVDEEWVAMNSYMYLNALTDRLWNTNGFLNSNRYIGFNSKDLIFTSEAVSDRTGLTSLTGSNVDFKVLIGQIGSDAGGEIKFYTPGLIRANHQRIYTDHVTYQNYAAWLAAGDGSSTGLNAYRYTLHGFFSDQENEDIFQSSGYRRPPAINRFDFFSNAIDASLFSPGAPQINAAYAYDFRITKIPDYYDAVDQATRNIIDGGNVIFQRRSPTQQHAGANDTGIGYFRFRHGSGGPSAYFLYTGQHQWDAYGTAAFTGTPAYYLAVDASGNIIEEPVPAGASDTNMAADDLTISSSRTHSMAAFTAWEIQDTSGDPLLYLSEVGVSQLAAGPDYYISLNEASEYIRFVTDGTQKFQIGVSALEVTAPFRFIESGGGTDYLGIIRPASVATSFNWTLPDAQSASNNSALVVDTSGNVDYKDLDVIEENTQTGTTYTTVLSDKGKMVTCNNASPIAVTIPPNSSVAYPIGTVLSFMQKGAGQITLGPGSGVTLNNANGLLSANQYSVITCWKEDTDTWIVYGDTTS